ncbi:MAG: NTP transferase domain-containing protein [Candidatus Thiodiazotropha taylori]|nr:NTP transferase domain-containing protein [Candidatus Thiodiazotropha taylori]
MQKIFIMCAGESKRWNNHLGVVKQMVPIDGEPLLHRTVRLLNERGFNSIHVVTNNPTISSPAVTYIKPKNHNWLVESIYSLEEYFHDENIILLGDVFFTPNALDQICSNTQDISIFGRPHPSDITGCPYKELFALRVTNASLKRTMDILALAVFLARFCAEGNGVSVAVSRIKLLLKSKRYYGYVDRQRELVEALSMFTKAPPVGIKGIIERSSLFWSVIRLLLGRETYDLHINGRLWGFYLLYMDLHLTDIDRLSFNSNLFYTIDDETEDFDFPSDYEEWLKRKVALN